MACVNCIQTTASITGFSPTNCVSQPGCAVNASCITYTGPALSCSGIATYDTLDIILQKIDPLLCASSGDYSTYNTYCLAPISTQKQFVESISNYVCTLNTNFTTFTGTTFPAYQTSVTAAITAVNTPAITCAVAGVTPSDTIPTILSKYCTTLTNISTNLDISGANWGSCYVVSPTPSTLTQGFNALIAQICLLKSQVAGAAVLPTFNNTANCLAGGASDSLVTTIGSIITRLCNTGTLNTSTLTWGCVTQPSGNQNLQDTLQNILTQLTTVSQAEPMSWSNDFTVTNVDNGNLCAGKHIALATPSTQDRFVAATPSDTSPATLQGKVTAGTNITLDFVTTPGQMIINSSGGAGTGDHKVLADGADSTANYLSLKLSGSTSSGVSVQPLLDTTNPSHVVNLTVNVDLVTLFTALLNAVPNNAGLQSLFCTTVGNCPSPCSAPTSVSVVYNAQTTTTTTTTSTTSTTSTTTTTTTTP